MMGIETLHLTPVRFRRGMSLWRKAVGTHPIQRALI
jgi:hypothetical protein